MIKILQVSIAITVMVLLTGCATSSMQSTVKPAQINDKALVVGTLTYSTVNIPAKTASLTLASADGKFSKTLSPIYNGGKGGTLSDPRSDQKGTFFSLLLAPGKYQLRNLQVTAKNGQVITSEAPARHFSVKAKKIYYIGNINIIVTKGSNKSALLISNRQGRDLGMFRAYYPSLDWQKDFQVRLAQ